MSSLCNCSWSLTCETDRVFCLRPSGHAGVHLCFTGLPPDDGAKVWLRHETPPYVEKMQEAYAKSKLRNV